MAANGSVQTSGSASPTQLMTDVNEEVGKLYLRSNRRVSSIGGSANAITATLEIPLTASYEVGFTFVIQPISDNTGSVTIDVDSRGAITVRYSGVNANLSSGQWLAGNIYVLQYDGTYFRIINRTLASAGSAASFRAEKSGSQSLGSATSTKVTFDTEIFDNGAYFDTANSRWTPPSGIVMLGGQIDLNVTSGTATVFLRKNGTNVAEFEAMASGDTYDKVNFSYLDTCDGDDYYEVFVTTTAGTQSVTASVTSVTTFFWGVKQG